MDFNRRKRPPLEISITPMIDVVFLLLIFFMVTTTFNRQTELKVSLPEAQGEETQQREKLITLMIDAEGAYFISGDDGKFHQLVNQKLSTLKRALIQASGNSRQIPFVISADGKTPHQAVISALDIASQIGFQRITFATRSVGGEPQ